MPARCRRRVRKPCPTSRCRTSPACSAGSSRWPPLEGDEYQLSPPHERALARSIGLRGEDGALPWAARHAAADGIEVGDRAWGLLTPVHWQVGRDSVTLVDPARLELDAAESRAAVRARARAVRERGLRLALGRAAALVRVPRLPRRTALRIARPRDRPQRRPVAADRHRALSAAAADPPAAERGPDAALHRPADRAARGARTGCRSTASGSAAAVASSRTRARRRRSIGGCAGRC